MAYLVPYKDFKKELGRLKGEHPKARHFVTASRYLNEYNQIIESSSDDGEPKGTSGKPTLAVLQGQDLINVAVIIVRYFGGTKLGTGGLVRAYGGATNDVVALAAMSKYEKKELYSIEFAYRDIGRLEYELEELKIEIVEKKFDTLKVIFVISSTQEIFENLCENVKRIKVL